MHLIFFFLIIQQQLSYKEPGLMKMRINSRLRQMKTKTCGIDTKKRTLAYIWYKRVCVHTICSFHVHMIRKYPTTLILPIS